MAGRLAFHASDLRAALRDLDSSDLDTLEFGVIAFDGDETVVGYNAFESARSGVDPERMIGRAMFAQAAPCTNNCLIAERYRTEPSLDEELDYVFTFRMAPQPVRLRLLAAPDDPRRYLCVVDRVE